MKRNVDLTIDRKFSTPRHRLTNLNSMILRNIYKKDKNKPWLLKYKSIDDVFNFNSSHLFLTGNKEQRIRKKLESFYLSGESCECCGKDLKKMPWNKGVGCICSDCDWHLKNSLNNDERINFLWKKEIESKSRARKIKGIDIDEFLSRVEPLDEL